MVWKNRNNNWAVATKARVDGIWTNIPFIGSYLGLNLRTSQMKVIGLGLLIVFVLNQQFPPTQPVQKVLAFIATGIITFYMVLPPKQEDYPEWTNFQLFITQLKDIRRPRKFKQLTEDDLKRR
jgi:hypothetical protein